MTQLMWLRKGRAYAQTFLEENCALVGLAEEDFSTQGLTKFLQFLEPMRGVAGTLFPVLDHVLLWDVDSIVFHL